jgi:PKD repeat protein
MAACNNGGTSVPVIASFAATPTSVVRGGSSTLSWSVTGAESISIDNGIGAVTGTSVVVTATTTTTYTLTATNAGGPATSTATVTVTPFPVPVIASFAATPASIVVGASATLAWSVTGATSISIDNGIGAVTGTSAVVTPTTTTTYTLTATNAGGPATSTATVTVTPFPVPVIASFTAAPSTIARGASSTLAWAVTGATSLSIDNGVGTVTGTSVAVTPTTTTTYTLTATNAGGPATSTATVTIPAASILFTSATGGSGFLGEMTEFPITVSGTASTFHAFAGRPWIADKQAMDGQALVWNGADNKFYGVLGGGGAWATGVLVSFDPATDTLVLLKTLSGRTYPAKRGLGSDMLPFNMVAGFYRNPLVTLDGKGLLLLSSLGGVDTEGLLVHVNIDPASASYLADTVVYDFFDYEVGQGNYCKSIRVGYLDGQTEMAWGKNGTDDVVFMARLGEEYVVSPNNAPNEPGTCAPYTFRPGEVHDRIHGRMFALRPGDMSDLSKPWTFALGYDASGRPGFGPLDPLLYMGRKIYWDTYQTAGAQPSVRWTTSGLTDDGWLDYYLGDTNPTILQFREVTYQAYRPGGMLPLDTGGNSLALYSGLNGSDTLPDASPRILRYDHRGRLSVEATLDGWYADRKFFRGATSSMVSRRFFANGGDYSSCLDGDVFGCTPSTIEEMNPAVLYPEQVLATGSETTTGQYFFGDPGVGGSVREPIADRYVVWFGTQRLGYSTTLNKYDRITGLTTTLTFDPVEGAYPKGKLLDLGNGTALGFIESTKPTTRQGKYGYGGGPGTIGSGPGFFLLDLGTGAIRDWIRYAPGATITLENYSQDLIRLDDGTVWTAVGYGDRFTSPKSYFRGIEKVNLSTGAFTELYSKEEYWNYAPPDPYTPAGRKSAAIYLPFWQSSVAITPTENQLVNVTLGCVRAANGAVVAQSDVFGPASAAAGNANRIVYGATYSPANDAMYLATSKVGSADLGTIFEVDKGVADAALCTAKPVVTALVSGVADVPSTKPLSTRAGALFYGTSNGKLMRLDVAGKTVALVADLKAAGSASSQVKGYLAETADSVVVAVVFDYDANGKNTARRLVSVVVGTGAATSRDVTALVDEWEPYPGVMRHN